MEGGKVEEPETRFAHTATLGSFRVQTPLLTGWRMELSASPHCLCVCRHSVVSDSVTPWTIAGQAPLSMGFSRQEYWSGLSFPSPRDLPDGRIEPASLRSPALAGGFFTWEAQDLVGPNKY